MRINIIKHTHTHTHPTHTHPIGAIMCFTIKQTVMSFLVTPFPIGWIYDQSGSYDTGFMFVAAVQGTGILALAADYEYERD